MFGFDFAALMAKAWFKPAVWLLVILALVLGFMAALQAYGRSQYQLGRSDKTNEVMAAQQAQLTTLIGVVQKMGDASTASAGNQAERMTSLEHAAQQVLDTASKQVMLVPGPTGKCQPTEDWRNSWNKVNALPTAGGK